MVRARSDAFVYAQLAAWSKCLESGVEPPPRVPFHSNETAPRVATRWSVHVAFTVPPRVGALQTFRPKINHFAQVVGDRGVLS